MATLGGCAGRGGISTVASMNTTSSPGPGPDDRAHRSAHWWRQPGGGPERPRDGQTWPGGGQPGVPERPRDGQSWSGGTPQQRGGGHPVGSPPRGPESARPPQPVVWQAVLGLGALVLMWPLTSLTGVAAVIGAPARAFGVIVVIGATWIGVVGLGRLPRPILTLTLTGVAGGGYLLLADLVAGAGVSGGLSLVALPFLLLDLIGGGAAWGVLAGLCAAGVQKLRGRR